MTLDNITRRFVPPCPCAHRPAETIDMVMPFTTPPSARWTREMLDALPDDCKRHEIIDCVPHVTPAPAVLHQHVEPDLVFNRRGNRPPLG